jgi:RimJ/RimL family protein N-acetyltransferase
MTFILKQYGITLKRIDSNDIELVRRWRNEPSIRKNMGYQKRITKEQQVKWFASVDNQLNYYFLIIIEGKKIGVINCKDVNLEDEYGEGGIFIWDKNYKSTPYPIFASLILLDFIFNTLEIGDKSFIRILPSNVNAIKYNKMLGYVLVPGQNKAKNQWYILTKGVYIKKAERFRVASKNFTNTNGELEVLGYKSARNLEVINELLEN